MLDGVCSIRQQRIFAQKSAYYRDLLILLHKKSLTVAHLFGFCNFFAQKNRFSC